MGDDNADDRGDVDGLFLADPLPEASPTPSPKTATDNNPLEAVAPDTTLPPPDAQLPDLTDTRRNTRRNSRPSNRPNTRPSSRRDTRRCKQCIGPLSNSLECFARCAGLSESDFCARNPRIRVCQDRLPEPPKPRRCCRAYSLKCLAQCEGLSEREFCSRFPRRDVCRNSFESTLSLPRRCCSANNLFCLAQCAGLSEREFCSRNARNFVCRGFEAAARPARPARPCCRAYSLKCLAQCAGQSEREFCASRPESDVCFSRQRGG